MSDIRFNTWLHRTGSGGVYQDSSGRVGIGSSVPTSALSVVGVVSATSFTGPLTGNVTGNLTGNVTGNLTGNVTGNVNSTGVTTVTSLNVGVGGTVITTSNVGSIGLGTANPQTKLHVCYSNTGDLSGGAIMLDDVNRNAVIYAPGTGAQGQFYLRRGTPSSYTDQLIIDANGNVRKPLQSFCDTGDTTSYNAAQSLTVSPPAAKGNWSSTVANVGNNFSTSTDLYTCPATGVYAVACTCSGDNYNGGSGGRVIFVVSFNGNYEEITELNSVYENQTPCVLRKLNANDTIGLGINGTGGSDFHVRLQVYFLG